MNVLSLGPNFASVPRINDELLNDIKIGITQFAYRKRWIDVFEQKSEDEEDITPLSVMDKIRRSKGPFQASQCIAPPVDYTLESEPASKMLNNYIINIVSSTKVESNLSKSEAIGIKSLKERDNISITISDKDGDFAVTSNNFQDYITQHHINSNPDVYKFVPPTRQYCGIMKEIANPTENTFRSQIKNKVQLLEELCIDKLRELTNDKIQDWRFHKTFSTHHSSLPTMYVMLKTHKLSPDANISEVPWIYQIPCKDCSATYCGQTSRPLHKRIAEHERYTRPAYTVVRHKYSAVAHSLFLSN